MIKNNELVSRFNEYSNEKIVALLWAGDDDAWEYIYLRAVIPVLKSPKVYSIMRDRQNTISSRDVLSMVFEKMLAEKKLNLYNYRCPVIYWMRDYVFGAVQLFCKKNPWAVSDEVYLNALNDKAAPGNFREELSDAGKCFVKLWRKSPMKAYVHLLRVQENMSSKDIMELLNISSVDNVNGYFSRACKDLRQMRDKLDRGEAL